MIIGPFAFASGKAPAPQPSVSPTSGMITISCDKTCTAKERARVELAQEKINELRKSECFQNYLQGRKLTYTGGRSKDELLKDLETRGVDAIATYYYRNNSVVGYRNVGSNVVHFNRKYHNRYGACFTVSNAFHEVSHVMGYSHPSRNSLDRANSVSYQINRAVEKCCKE